MSHTTWHITFGTYGARLHGGRRATVARPFNKRGEAFVPVDPQTETAERTRMHGAPVLLDPAVRTHVEAIIPGICERGGWTYHVAAAPEDGDHVHVLLEADANIDPKRIREWLKRWITEALDERWGRPAGGTWWAKGGSTKPVKEPEYFRNAFAYIQRQRSTPDR